MKITEEMIKAYWTSSPSPYEADMEDPEAAKRGIKAILEAAHLAAGEARGVALSQSLADEPWYSAELDVREMLDEKRPTWENFELSRSIIVKVGVRVLNWTRNISPTPAATVPRPSGMLPHPLDVYEAAHAPAIPQSAGLDAGTEAPNGATFFVGDQVEKYTGDYQITGEVRAVLLTKRGKTRYVVEHEPGILHIYSRSNLRALGGRANG